MLARPLLARGRGGGEEGAEIGNRICSQQRSRIVPTPHVPQPDLCCFQEVPRRELIYSSEAAEVVEHGFLVLQILYSQAAKLVYQGRFALYALRERLHGFTLNAMQAG